MSNYICKYGLYHDKPCINGEPKSNNGWIYTAYAKALGLEVNHFKLQDCFDLCLSSAIDDDVYSIYRLPEKRYPPISRDEIIGQISLGFKPLKYTWFMYKEAVNPSYLSAIKTLWRIRKENRNYFWEGNLVETLPIAMRLWWHDQYYVNNMMAVQPTILQWLMFQLYALVTILQNNVSSKNILWLQLHDTGSFFWIRFINQKENFKQYFQDGNPLRLGGE